jgi:hypothetical protein
VNSDLTSEQLNPRVGELTGPDPELWTRINWETGDNPVPVRDLSIGIYDREPYYVVGAGSAWRIDGVIYLIEHDTADLGRAAARRVLDELRQVYGTLPKEPAGLQRGYAWLSGPNPRDAHLSTRYNRPGFRSVAVNLDGHTKFWNRSLDPADGPFTRLPVFDHEYGPNVDAHATRLGIGSKSPLWQAAARADTRRLARDFWIRDLSLAPELRKPIRLRPDSTKPWPYGVTDYGKTAAGRTTRTR